MRAAVYCGTRNIYQYMIPSMLSLLKYSNVEKIYFLIEDNNFPYPLPPEVECINVSQQQWFDPDGPNYISSWSYMILLRAAFTKIFPHLDKILSLDCDTIIRNNISELWDISIDDYYFAGVHEPEKSRENFRYINAGVMMFNLKKIREEHKDDEYIYDLNNCYRPFPEQECFSALSQGKILELPSKYNVSCVTASTTKEKILHFAGNKQWKQLKIIQEYMSMPLDIKRNQYNNTDIDIIGNTDKFINQYPIHFGDNGNGYILFTNQQDIITETAIITILNTIADNESGYMFLWNDNCLVLKREFINSYNLDISCSVYGLARLGYTILSYLQTLDCCRRTFIFNETLIKNSTDFSIIFKNTIDGDLYFVDKCKENKIIASYMIRELNYMIVRLYWLFLLTIQERPELGEEHWYLIKKFYDKYYSKYELTASATLPEPYYKINQQLIRPKLTEWKKPIRVNIGRFLQELKTSESLPRRYKFD